LSSALCESAGTPACARVLELPTEPPEWVDLLPAGVVEARDGRRWTVADAEAVAAASRTRAGTTDLAIDYEHQSHKSDGEAPAAAWIKEIRVENGMIRGRVEWTENAAARLRAREYRYLSPTFLFDAETGRVKVVTGAGLTNNPALDLPALATDRHGRKEPMNDEQLNALREALGLAADADAPAILAAVAAAVAGNQALAKVAEKVGLAEDASGDDVLAAAHRAPAAGEFVPRSEFDAVANRLRDVETSSAEEKATAAVDAAVEAGKVTPAQRDWALAYAKADPEGFGSYVEATPAIVRPGRTGTGAPGTGGDPDAALTDDELAVCRAMGVSADDYKAARKASRDGTPPERKKPESE